MFLSLPTHNGNNDKEKKVNKLRNFIQNKYVNRKLEKEGTVISCHNRPCFDVAIKLTLPLYRTPTRVKQNRNKY